jgi:hypothetical protein
LLPKETLCLRPIIIFPFSSLNTKTTILNSFLGIRSVAVYLLQVASHFTATGEWQSLGLLKSCFYFRCFFLFISLRALFRVLTWVFFKTNWRQTSHQKDQRRWRALTRWLLQLREKADSVRTKARHQDFVMRSHVSLLHLRLYCSLPHSLYSFPST